MAVQAAEERSVDAEARSRELYEVNKRLEVHVGVSRAGQSSAEWERQLRTVRSGARAVGVVPAGRAVAISAPPRLAQELESRKRAPLYQKKQEEELKAAVEKAQEAEVRAVPCTASWRRPCCFGPRGRLDVGGSPQHA